MSRTQVWLVVVRNIVDVVFRQKRRVDHPRSVRDDLIHPATMADGFTAFYVIHNAFEFMLFYLLVAAHPNEQVHVRE
jgi:hypothetical protein